MNKICPICENQFETIYPEKVYCSEGCKGLAHSRRRRQLPDYKEKKAKRERQRKKRIYERMKVDLDFAAAFLEKAREKSRRWYQNHRERESARKRGSISLCLQCKKEIHKNKAMLCKECKAALKVSSIACPKCGDVFLGNKRTKYCEKCRVKNLSVLDAIRNYLERRRAKAAGLKADFKQRDWHRALRFFNNRCAYCGCEERLHQDHFIPHNRGGGYTRSNIVPSCQSCNSRKSDNDPRDFLPAAKYRQITTYLQGLQ
jgi:hypothetical protein